MHFWKSYICSNKLDVQETNLSFAQFNRIRNHLFGYAGLRMDGVPAVDLWDLIVAVLGNTNQINKERGDLLMNKREVRSTPHTNQKRKKSHGMNDDLDNVDLLLQTSFLLVRKLCCMCLKTTKQ